MVITNCTQSGNRTRTTKWSSEFKSDLATNYNIWASKLKLLLLLGELLHILQQL